MSNSDTPCERAGVHLAGTGHSQTECPTLDDDFEQIIDFLSVTHRALRTCSNPECPDAGRCGGECARNF